MVVVVVVVPIAAATPAPIQQRGTPRLPQSQPPHWLPLWQMLYSREINAPHEFSFRVRASNAVVVVVLVVWWCGGPRRIVGGGSSDARHQPQRLPSREPEFAGNAHSLRMRWIGAVAVAVAVAVLTDFGGYSVNRNGSDRDGLVVVVL